MKINNKTILAVLVLSILHHGNGKKQRQEFHDDASTGTVTSLSNSQEDALTCDGIMAKSVIKANEAKALAEEQRDEMKHQRDEALAKVAQLQEALTTEKSAHQAQIKLMEDDINNVEETVAKVKAEADEIVVEATKVANEKMKQADQQIQDMQSEVESKLKTVQEEHIIALETVKARGEQTLQEVTAKHDAKVAELTTATNDKVKRYEESLSMLKQEAETNVSKAEDRVRKKHKEMEEKELSLKKEKEDHVKKIQEESAAKIAATESNLQSQVTGMKKDMEEIKAKAAKEIDTKVGEVKTKLSQKEKQEEVLNAEIKKLQRDRKLLEEDLAKRRKELAEWEELHSKRTYCNMTHIGEDTKAALATASKKAADRASLAKDRSFKVARQVAGQVAEQASVAAAPGVQKSRELYNQYLKNHMDSKVIPVHKKHVAPVLGALGKQLQRSKVAFGKFVERLHSMLVQEFDKLCPKLLESLVVMDGKMDSSVPNVAINHVNRMCSKPQQTVNSLLRATLLVFVILYRKLLWRTTKKILLLPFRLFWYMATLQFLFPKRKQRREETSNETTERVKIKKEQNGKAQ